MGFFLDIKGKIKWRIVISGQICWRRCSILHTLCFWNTCHFVFFKCGAHCLPLCLPISLRLKSHIITGSRDGVSMRGYCALVRWSVWERWPKISSCEHPVGFYLDILLRWAHATHDGVTDCGHLPSLRLGASESKRHIKLTFAFPCSTFLSSCLIA